MEATVQAGAAQAAFELAQHLQADGGLAPIQVGGYALVDGEVAFADVTCWASRYYGTGVVRPRPAGFFEDHPAFGRRWVSNRGLDARRLREAEAAAEPQWRDHTTARVLFTSLGLRVMPCRETAWLPFDHALLTSVAPGSSEVVLSYTTCAPLRLGGESADWLGMALDHVRRMPQ
ncbi:hypothetical protein [Streptomyces sp. NPDC060194]|uniref:hypothetical protein n=1 Tax=Streptomyces sp. NPDC060194 TaxID=3347069 RepID=UPI003661326A